MHVVEKIKAGIDKTLNHQNGLTAAYNKIIIQRQNIIFCIQIIIG